MTRCGTIELDRARPRRSRMDGEPSRGVRSAYPIFDLFGFFLTETVFFSHNNFVSFSQNSASRFLPAALPIRFLVRLLW